MKSIPIGFMVLLTLTVGNAYAQDPKEAAKIQYLILSVEALDGAKFLRNGREYDAKAAAGHRFADGTAMETEVFFRNKLKSFAADKQ